MCLLQVDGATTEVEFFDTVEGDIASMNRKMKRPEIESFSVVALSGAVAEVKKVRAPSVHHCCRFLYPPHAHRLYSTYH